MSKPLKLTKEQQKRHKEIRQWFMESPILLSAKRSLARHDDQMKKVAESVAPILKHIQEANERFQQFKELATPTIVHSEVVQYRRPVEYDILEELQEMNKNHKQLYASQESNNVIIYDTKSGSLDRNLGGKCFSYDLTESGKRKKLLDTLLYRDSYVQTKELEDILSCPSSQAVAKIVQTFNDYAINTLRLDKKTKLIQGKKGSGYRINPKIHIEKE